MGQVSLQWVGEPPSLKKYTKSLVGENQNSPCRRSIFCGYGMLETKDGKLRGRKMEDTGIATRLEY